MNLSEQFHLSLHKKKAYLHIFLPTNLSSECLETKCEQLAGTFSTMAFGAYSNNAAGTSPHPTSTAAANCWAPSTGLAEFLKSSFNLKKHTDHYDASYEYFNETEDQLFRLSQETNAEMTTGILGLI